MKKKLSLLLMLLMVMTVTTVHAQRLMQTLGRGVVVAKNRTGEVECLCERNENQYESCHEYQYADRRFETARWK